jgi:hypothetical protein
MMVRNAYLWIDSMTEMTQQEFLRTVKSELQLEWNDLAVRAGIKPRALKTYRMPPTVWLAMPSKG